MARLLAFTVSAFFILMIFSPYAQTSEDIRPIPSTHLHLVDDRLEIVYQDVSLSEELGLVESPIGKIDLFARVADLDEHHHKYIEDMGGEITDSFSRFNTFGFIIDLQYVPEVVYLPGFGMVRAKCTLLSYFR